MKTASIQNDEFLSAMTAVKAGVRTHFPNMPKRPITTSTRSIGSLGAFRKRIERQSVRLSISMKLTDEDMENVIESVSAIVK